MSVRIDPAGHAPATDHETEHLATAERFDDPAVARRYAARKNRPTQRNDREWGCVRRCLDGLPAGANVLDLPCGTGRLTLRLRRSGFTVTAADYSPHMVALARDHYLTATGLSINEGDVRFTIQDVMRTSFGDGEFDAVVCSRLLHHYPTAEVRTSALRELARISRRFVVVSFFSNVALSAARFHLGNRLHRRSPHDRIPVWPRDIRRDIESAGLRWGRSHAVRYGISPQTYVRLEVARFEPD